jgi:MoaA/NifB/PqqE/SkfB family radical SAM enzyme
MSDLIQIRGTKQPAPTNAAAGAASAENDEYSPFKAAWHLDRIEALRRGEHVAPVHVHFVPSDLCNQDCGWCAYRWSDYSSNQHFNDEKGNHNPNRRIPTAKALEMIADFAAMDVKAIEFTGGGEPTVHPDIDQLVAASIDRGLAAAMVSNGVLVRRKLPAELAQRLAWWRISVDAATPATYALTRRSPEAHFAQARETIEWLAKLKGADGSGPTLGMGFAVTRDNYKEIIEGARLAREWGADNVRFSALFNPEGPAYYDGIYEEARDACKAAVAEFHKPAAGFRVFARFGEKMDDLFLGNPDYQFCGYERLVTYVGGDQNIYRCCVYSYNDHGLLGSVADKSFRDLWFSAEVRAKLETFDARSCQRCQFNDRNRFIGYLVKSDPPRHSEFV